MAQVITPPGAPRNLLGETLQNLYKDLFNQRLQTEEIQRRRRQEEMDVQRQKRADEYLKLQQQREERLAEKADLMQELQLRDALMKSVIPGAPPPPPEPTPIGVQPVTGLGDQTQVGPAQPAMLENLPQRPVISLGPLSFRGQEFAPAMEFVQRYESELREQAARDAAQKRVLEGDVPVTPESIAALREVLGPIAELYQGAPAIPRSLIEKAATAETREPRAPSVTAFGGTQHQYNPKTGKWVPLGPSEAALTREARKTLGITDERSQRLMRVLPNQGDWRSVTAQTPVVDDESSRSGVRAQLKEWAADNNVLFPDKKQREIANAANADLADIQNVQTLLKDPDVIKDLGRWRGRLTEFLARGWVGSDRVNPKTLELRAALSNISAKKRHELYGAAVTGLEQGFAERFIAATDHGYDSIVANVNEYADQIERAMDARFGAAGSPPAAGGGETIELERDPANPGRLRPKVR